ncbi:nucleotidyltransferase domain-containing protein [Rheinheimera riviphila]|uniref:Nucleotidyltransferase domain-containing protein n=1 Tax=Rheinheimera riviphila TaxID=1834037 RepID=A0A437QJ44_9GAMM|nr:nucleotidyltransferase domain-containing protein [Rheinheimera riviphila]RVU34420.1 nucleotidyltransferase domain-containing protein [Rheinheimera riviphila]
MFALVDLLFTGYRRQVLGLLLLKPDQAWHVREIARLTHTQPGTLHKELTKLAQAGILKKTEQGNQLWYQADTRCVVFEELASILRKTSGLADVLRQALLPVADQLQFAAVFGSVASNKATATSDIDLLLVGDLSFAAAVKQLYPAQQQLGREINPKLYSLAEWQKALAAPSGFITALLESPLLMIAGDKDDLRQSFLLNEACRAGFG